MLSTTGDAILSGSMRLIDVKHLGTEKVIGCWELDGFLVDPGPEESCANLVEALGGEQPRGLLLTHIHLDHAGATGALVKRWPELPVYVHERGAPHLIDPSKLLASATKLYGDDMERLWGEVLPVPERNVTALAGGEEVEGFRVAYTPGHASHHVSYFHADSGRAFVGDMAGCQVPPSDFLLPPTPPPDIDIEAWERSIDAILEWSPQSLGITHFGAIDDPAAHMARMRERLREQAELARELEAEAFETRVRDEMRASCEDEQTFRSFEQAAPPETHWPGLHRYWSKRAQG